MNMKSHILAALREKYKEWEELLTGLTEDQITSPRFDLDWSIQDVVVHLWVWQQITLARMQAGSYDHEPEFPGWIVDSIADWEENADQVNTVTFERNHHKPWSEVYENWRAGFLRILDIGETIPERDLLDGDRYSWLRGYSLASILIASYDHHQEHLEKVNASLA